MCRVEKDFASRQVVKTASSRITVSRCPTVMISSLRQVQISILATVVNVEQTPYTENRRSLSLSQSADLIPEAKLV